MRKQTLPMARCINGKWCLDEPYDYNNRVTCEAFGQMGDGTIVWQDNQGNQYIRYKFYGKFFFVKTGR